MHHDPTADDHTTDHLHQDSTALVEHVARDFLELVARVQADGRDPHVVLTGGGIAAQVHAKVAALAAEHQVDWSRVHFWWGDERFVASDDDERNAKQAADAMLDHLDVDPAFVHRAPGSDQAPDAAQAARQYAEQIEQHGPENFDLVMLSLGPDGHVASMFPGHEALSAEGWTTSVTDSPKPPPERVTLTLPALARTSQLWIMATGAEKAEVLARTRTSGPVSEAPARALLGATDVHWYMDEEAAAPPR